MPVTSIRFYSGPAPRRQPKAGDLRETKKHGKQVRVHERSNGMLVVGSSGRHRYDWVSYDEAHRRGCGHLLPKEAA